MTSKTDGMDSLARVGIVDIIRNRGTFYDFIGENPNALERAIFWLRAFQAPEGYLTIPSGVSTITSELEKWLEQNRLVSIHRESSVVGIEPSTDSAHVRILVKGSDDHATCYSEAFDHVILCPAPESTLRAARELP